jgi:hypothetical protein
MRSGACGRGCACSNSGARSCAYACADERTERHHATADEQGSACLAASELDDTECDEARPERGESAKTSSHAGGSGVTVASGAATATETRA